MACQCSAMTDPSAIEQKCRDYARQHYPELFDA
jgi:hypothetical protein